MNASALLRHGFWTAAVATARRGPSSLSGGLGGAGVSFGRRSLGGCGGVGGASSATTHSGRVKGRRAFRCNAAQLTSEDDAALEAEADRPTRQSHQVRLVQWYPGHIARAEMLLKEQLKAVDAIVEVRDIRIPLATTHPDIPQWIGSKLRVLVLNRADMVSDAERSKWVAWFKRNGEEHVVLTDARSGKGVNRVKEVALLVSKEVNDKRRAKGLMPRPVRTAVIGYPNVGKSALINRLTKTKACASAPRPGVTRNLRWVRIGGELDLLDSPGVLPPRLADQKAAARLAMANDIGEASYLLFEEMSELPGWLGKGGLREVTAKRFKIEIDDDMTGEDFVAEVAEKACSSDLERAGVRILNDFRNGALGNFCLEPAPSSSRKNS